MVRVASSLLAATHEPVQRKRQTNGFINSSSSSTQTLTPDQLPLYPDSDDREKGDIPTCDTPDIDPDLAAHLFGADE